jgi:hypothetical protein
MSSSDLFADISSSLSSLRRHDVHCGLDVLYVCGRLRARAVLLSASSDPESFYLQPWPREVVDDIHCCVYHRVDACR